MGWATIAGWDLDVVELLHFFYYLILILMGYYMDREIYDGFMFGQNNVGY